MKSTETGHLLTVAAGFGKAESSHCGSVATGYSHEQTVKLSDAAWGAAGLQERLDALHASRQL